LWEDEGEMGIFISTEELERIQNEEDLINLVEEKL
jgi:acyl carrier protein